MLNPSRASLLPASFARDAPPSTESPDVGGMHGGAVRTTRRAERTAYREFRHLLLPTSGGDPRSCDGWGDGAVAYAICARPRAALRHRARIAQALNGQPRQLGGILGETECV